MGSAAPRHPRLLLAPLLVALLAPFAPATQSHALVYWANPNHAGLNRAKLDGTDVDRNFLHFSRSSPQAVEVDAEHLYWDNTTSFVPPRASIGRADLNATGIDDAFIQDLPYDQVWDIEVGGGKIYWLGGVNGAQWIGRADLDGSSVEPHLVATLACGGGESCGQAGALALDTQGGLLFWDAEVYDEVEEAYVPTIARATTTGAGYDVDFVRPENLVPVNGLVVAGSHLYWADSYYAVVEEEGYDVGTVGRSTTAGGSVNTRFVDPGIGQMGAIQGVGAVDDSHIYLDVNMQDSPFIGRVGIGGSPLDLDLIPEQDDPGGLAAWSMAVDSLQGAPPRPVVGRSIQLGYSREDGEFRGGITSSDANCERGEKVSIFRRRAGEDDQIGTDRSNRQGRFSVVKRGVAGSYYARANTSWTSEGDCAAARSGVLRV